MQFVVSLLIKNLSYIHADNFVQEQLGIGDLFDWILISADESKLCLFKKATELNPDDISYLAINASNLIEKNSTIRRIKYWTLFFLTFEKGIDPKLAKDILNLDFFKYQNYFIPVIVDLKAKKLIYNKWKIPLSFLELLLFIGGKIKRAETEEIAKVESENLKPREMKTLSVIENFRRRLFNTRPYVTWFFIIINAVVWILMETWDRSPDPETLIRYGAKVGPLIWEGQLWRLITPAFLHIRLLHLLSNCIIIFFLGPLLESAIGRWRLALIYLFSAVYGNLLSLKFSSYLSVGASSAVFGMLGAMITYGITYRGEIPRNYYRVISFYLCPFLIYNLLIGLWYPNIDNYAHIGGLIGGTLLLTFLGVEYPPEQPKKIQWGTVSVTAMVSIVLFLTAMKPSDEAYKIYYYIIGNAGAVEGNYTKAISNLEQSLQIDPNYDKSRELLGRVYSNLAFDYIRGNKFDSALKYYERSLVFLDIAEENFKVLNLTYEGIGTCYDQKYKNLEAIRNFKKALVFYPQSLRIKKEISEQYEILSWKSLLDRDFAQAEDSARKSIRYYSGNLNSRILLGKIYYLQGDFTNAAGSWKSILEIDSNNQEALKALKNNIFKNLWYPPNIDHKDGNTSKKAITLNKEGEKILMTSGDYVIAASKFKEASKLDEKYITPLINLAKIEIFLDNPDKAIKIIKKAQKINPNNWETLTVQASAQLRKNRLKDAKDILERCIRVKPDFAESYWLMGIINKNEEDYRSAEKNLKKAVLLYPDNVLFRLELVKLYYITGKNEPFWAESNNCLVFTTSQNRMNLEFIILTFLGRKKSQPKAT